MRLLLFNIDNYEDVYDKLVNELGYAEDIFLTTDVIEIEEKDFDEAKNALSGIEFEVISR